MAQQRNKSRSVGTEKVNWFVHTYFERLPHVELHNFRVMSSLVNMALTSLKTASSLQKGQYLWAVCLKTVLLMESSGMWCIVKYFKFLYDKAMYICKNVFLHWLNTCEYIKNTLKNASQRLLHCFMNDQGKFIHYCYQGTVGKCLLRSYQD